MRFTCACSKTTRLVRYLLPIIISSILIYQVFMSPIVSRSVIEGMNSDESEDSSPPQHYQKPPLHKDPLYLAKLNAANISYLKSKVHDYRDLSDEVDKLKKHVHQNSVAIAKIAVESQKALGQLGPKDPGKHLPPDYRN